MNQNMPPDLPSLDALMPESMARKAEELGVKKARRDLGSLLALAVLAGAYIALGGLFATVAMSGAGDVMPYGITRLVGGLVFSLGLILVIIGGAQLFTGDMLMVMAWASGRLTVGDMARVWVIVWCGNLVGAVGTALLVFLSGHYGFGHGAVGKTALYIAQTKSSLPATQAFFLGILCNVLVCLAVWLAFSARSVTDKVVAIIFPIAAFVAAGFEHCVANMYFIPLGMLIENFAPAQFWADIGKAPTVTVTMGALFSNLIPVTFGNLFGGAVLVGAMYWFVYLRPRRPDR